MVVGLSLFGLYRKGVFFTFNLHFSVYFCSSDDELSVILDMFLSASKDMGNRKSEF